MNVNDFVRAAKFPPNWKEAHLQDYIDRRLQQLGYKTETEVNCGHNCGRADIVADPPNKPDYPGDVIEVKKWLTREEIFQARGQAESYQKLIKSNAEGQLRNITVIGFAPVGQEEYRKAKVAQNLCLQSGIDVVFVNEEEMFLPSYNCENAGASTKQPTSDEEECILNLNYPFGKLYIKYKRANHYINDVACGISNFAKQVLAIAKLIIKTIKFIIKIIISIYLFFKRLTRKRYKSYKKNQISKYLKFIWIGLGVFYLFVASIEVNSKFNLSNQTQIIRKSK